MNKMMSRVERKKVEKRKRFKKKLKRLPITLIKDLGYLVLGLIYAIYKLVNIINTFFGKVFLKLPRLIKVAIVYSLIAGCAFGFMKPRIEYKTITKEVVKEVNTSSVSKKVIVEEESKEVCNLDSTSCKIANKAKEMGLSEDESLMVVAISLWETGDYTSSAFINKNNVGGMMCQSGLIQYATLDDGINAFVENLKYNYFDEGLNTLESIQKKYCPVGASNDPNNLNQYWLDGTTQKYNELKTK